MPREVVARELFHAPVGLLHLQFRRAILVLRRNELQIAICEIIRQRLRVRRQRSGARIVFVKERRRLGEGLLCKLLAIFFARRPLPVGRLLVQEKQERFVLRSRFQKFHTEVRGDVGAISLHRQPPSRCHKRRVVIHALPRQNDPPIKPRRIAPEVPFSNPPCVVARPLHELRNCLL